LIEIAAQNGAARPLDLRASGLLDRRGRKARCPRGSQLAVDLEMELEGVGKVPQAECLIPVEIALREKNPSLGHVEGLFVPVDDRYRVPVWPHDQVSLPFGRQGNLADSHLENGAALHARVEGGREKLGSEANAEDRELALDRVAQEPTLMHQMRVVGSIVYAHGAPHHDDTADFIHAGDGVALVHSVESELEAARRSLAGDGSRALPGHVLNHGPRKRRWTGSHGGGETTTACRVGRGSTMWLQLSRLLLFLALGAVLSGTAAFALADTIAADSARADSLYRAKSWKGAAEAYEAIVRKAPREGRSWFRLGVSYQSLGRMKEAINAYLRAESIGHNPLVHFNLAGAYAHEKKDGEAFEWLTRAVDGGFQWLQAYLEDPDLARLRSDPRFAALESRIRANAKPCAARAEARQFDFWLGDWYCRTPQGDLAGRNSITLDGQDCVLVERWTDTRGSTGMSFNWYDPSGGRWHQTWIDHDGSVSEFAGAFRDGAMRLEGFRSGGGGDRIPARLTLTPVAADTVRQLGENSTDGGKTWVVLYDFIYTRK